MAKPLKLKPEQMKKLIPDEANCIASDKITVEGLPVGYMYREAPEFEGDSGWRFFSGTESEDYLDDEANTDIYALNTLANYDAAIIPYLKFAQGTEWERTVGTEEFLPLEEEL